MRGTNQNDVAYRVANQRTFPGWGHMLANGASTLWESWKKPDNAGSLNHPMFGSISEWFYRSVLGINSAAPGFEKILIKPQPAGELTWAKGSYHSIRGSIISDWKKDAQSFTLHVSIPANTIAEVWVPSKENGTITESGKSINAVSELKLTGYRDGYAVIEIGSGDYSFKSNL